MNKLKENILPALLHVLYNLFVYYLFVLPFHLWVNAVNRLAEQKDSGSLSLVNIKSAWPFLSFMKVFLLEFLFDGMIMLCYVIGPLFGLYMLFTATNGGGMSGFFTALVGCYYYVVIITIIRDVFTLLILPFRKFLSWARKPAQYMDLEIKNK